ncbi:hypothetical protein Q4489_04650 [Thalassotalea sp. 1_MG-2023]|uniref:hypothetical protein n=1 Tax=Thalassotalea sp. 1_MG-2023 TaxID=3062680 RepID=UPI0026E34240|nr:hypothetical protein [Thalassotalea sp. 1_MG-2023]MDO6426288.1 hypothetical protein [Thalassotalea sp. 1_MG-2023]
MKQRWQTYADKFLQITPREQYLIILTGLIAIIFIIFSLFIDDNLLQIEKLTKQHQQNVADIQSTQMTVDVLAEALKTDPNDAIRKQLSQYQLQMSEVDQQLSLLASDLINPIQMRHALIELLSSTKAVSLTSFDVFAAEPMELTPETEKKNVAEQSLPVQSLSLYKHGVKLTLSGDYFALKDYIAALEELKWKFFWQTFDYQLVAYPKGELTITMYSLSTNKEFLGV